MTSAEACVHRISVSPLLPTSQVLLVLPPAHSVLVTLHGLHTGIIEGTGAAVVCGLMLQCGAWLFHPLFLPPLGIERSAEADK